MLTQSQYGTTPKEAAEKKKGKKLSKGKEVREDEKEEAKEKKKEKRKRREDPSSGVPSAIYEGEVSFICSSQPLGTSPDSLSCRYDRRKRRSPSPS